MIDLKDSIRYTTLVDQFYIDKSNPFYFKIKDSLERFFAYIYNYTDIMFLDFIDEKAIYGYIMHHKRMGFKNITFQQTVKDVKTYLFFLKCVKSKKQIPSVNLSIGNYLLWSRL